MKQPAAGLHIVRSVTCLLNKGLIVSSSTPSSPLLHRVLPALLTLLAIFGVPAGTIALFHTVVLAHPLLTLLLALLYEGMILLLGFISRVWENLQSKWVVRVADWCDYWVQTRLSRYRKRYYDYVGYHHRDFDVRGLSIRGTYKLELDQVFVDLSIDTTIIQKATVNPVPQALRQGSHSIWDFLGSLLLHGQHFAIIGPPGSGKTTLLKHIALTMVSQHRSPIPSQRERPQRKLPILLFLRDHTSAIGKAASEDLPFTLIDALHDHLKKWGQPLPPPGWFQRQLQLGRCLVLLDGLDEVADAQQRPNRQLYHPGSTTVHTCAGRAIRLQMVSCSRDHEQAER